MFKKPKFFQNQSVGFVGSYFTEQLLRTDFNLKVLEKGFCETITVDSQLTTVFIDTEFFNIDNSWSQFSLIDLIGYLESLDLMIVLVTYRKKTISSDYFHLHISKDCAEYKTSEHHIAIPYLINENIFNPINQKKDNHLLILKNDKNESKFNQNLVSYLDANSGDYNIYNMNDSSKPSLIKLVNLIRKSTVLYIDKPNEINQVLINYIKLICAALNTFLVIKDVSTDQDDYSFTCDDDMTILHTIKSYENLSILNDHYLIKNARSVYLDNSLMQCNSLSDILNEKNIHKKDIKISVVTSTVRKQNLDDLITRLNHQNYVQLEIVLLTHGFKLTNSEKEQLTDLSKHPIKFLYESSSVVYGKCLNICIENMDYEYFAKIDDDDFYYPNYLIDSWLVYQYSKAELVGKHSTYWYMKNQNLVAERFQGQVNKYTKYVAGATLFSRSEFIKRYKFSPLASGIDRDLLSRIDEDKHRIYCGNPYEFCVYRDDDNESHTWKVDDLYILRSSLIKFWGSPELSLTVEN